MRDMNVLWLLTTTGICYYGYQLYETSQKLDFKIAFTPESMSLSDVSIKVIPTILNKGYTGLRIDALQANVYGIRNGQSHLIFTTREPVNNIDLAQNDTTSFEMILDSVSFPKIASLLGPEQYRKFLFTPEGIPIIVRLTARVNHIIPLKGQDFPYQLSIQNLFS